jgi:hypothetical protein
MEKKQVLHVSFSDSVRIWVNFYIIELMKHKLGIRMPEEKKEEEKKESNLWLYLYIAMPAEIALLGLIVRFVLTGQLG